MITTVTTSTVTTVSSVTAIGLSTGIALFAVLCLVLFSMQKESLSASTSHAARVLSRALNVAIVPLAMGFGMILVSKLIEVLGH